MSLLDPLFEKCRQVDSLSPEVATALEEAFEVIAHPKGAVFLKAGDTCSYMHFVLTGLVRVYYFVDDKEITSRLMSEGFFITSYISYFTRRPGNEFMEAYEDCTLARISVEDAHRIYRHFPTFNYTARALTEYSFFLSEERTIALRNTSAEHRFRFFMERHPELVNRVASRHIASYLGMTEETFSRTKKKVLYNRV